MEGATVRKNVVWLLALLGGFLLVSGIMAQFYAPSRLMKTPIDSNTTTALSGTAELSDGTILNKFPVKAWSITLGDTDKSDGDVAVFATSSCLVKDEGGIDGCVSSDDPQDRLLSASTDNFANDRVTALAVNDPKYLPADAQPHEGLTNKWPFDAEKKTYPFWDGTVGGAVDAVYQGTETFDGLETYGYQTNVAGQPMEIADGVPGTYDDQTTIYIDPVTGSIINQTDHQVQNDADGNIVLDLNLAFTDAQIQTKVDEADSNTSQLNVIRHTVPLIGYLVGIPLLLIGIALLWMMNRGGSPTTGGGTRSDREQAGVSLDK
jgi:hypothetical protein